MGSPLQSGPVYIYRIYDEAGSLVYVGITDNPKRRIETEHRKRSKWFAQARRADVRLMPDRATAVRAEAFAIEVEQPSRGVWYDRNQFDASFVEPHPIEQFDIDLTPRKLFD